jgi:hypothetical protein
MPVLSALLLLHQKPPAAPLKPRMPLKLLKPLVKPGHSR